MSDNQVPTRPLGKNGPQVPRLGLGLMPLSGFYNLPVPDEEQLAFLDEAWKAGARFWDTCESHPALFPRFNMTDMNLTIRPPILLADYYGNNEAILGKWFALNPDKRADIFLATKFGHPTPPLNNTTTGRIDSSPEYCRLALERSLTRLGLDCVDLYYIHRLDKVTPVEKTIAAMVELKKAGKIKYLGISECSAATLRRAHAVHPITAIQMEYSPFCLEIEDPAYGSLLATARELGVAMVCYSPLGNGLLGGDIKQVEDVKNNPGDARGMVLPWLAAEYAEGNLAVIEGLRTLAAQKGVSVAQLTLAWIFKQGEDVFPIPGTVKAARVGENLKSLEVELSEEEEREIRRIAGGVKGTRLPDFMLADCFTDSPALEG